MRVEFTFAACLIAAISGLPGVVLPRRSALGQKTAVLLMVVSSIIGLIVALGELLDGRVSSMTLRGALPDWSFHFSVDPLAAFFLAPIFLLGSLGSVYGLGYWRQAEHLRNGCKLSVCYGVLVAGLGLVTLAGDGITFLFAWEIMALAAFFLVTGPAVRNSIWFTRGVAVSSLVLSHEPWRAVTALTLHADDLHVLGNAVSGTIFASAVQRRLGAGGAALAVLASGIFGNLGNAVYHHVMREEHQSIGASTAIFGAIGLLAATELVLHRKRSRGWLDVAAPIVGGFALLGALGSGSGDGRTDLGAHLFGFLSGVIIGLGVAFPMRRRTLALDLAGGPSSLRDQVSLGSGAPRWWVQTVLGALAAAIVVVSWEMALRPR